MSGHRRGPTLYYRCRAADLIPSQRADHPSTVYLREDSLVESLGAWLRSALGPGRVETTIEDVSAAGLTPLADDSRRHAISARIADAQQRLDRFKTALAKGSTRHRLTWPVPVPTSHCSITRSRLNSAEPTWAWLSGTCLCWSAACQRHHR